MGVLGDTRALFNEMTSRSAEESETSLTNTGQGACCSQSVEFLQKFTCNDKKIVCGLMTATTFYGILMGLLAPFYIIEVTDRGLPASAVGIIMGLYAMMQVFGSPLSARLLPAARASRSLHLGLLVAGGATATLASLALVRRGPVFLAGSCMLRMVEGLGEAALFTAAATIIASRLPADASLLISMVDTASLVGSALGPPIGGGLYTVGGMALPLAAVGCTVLLLTSISWCLIPTVGGDRERVAWIEMSKKMMRSSEVWLNTIIIVVANIMWTGLDPYIELDVHASIDVAPATLGLYYLVCTFGSVISGLRIGRLCDVTNNNYPVIFFSILVEAGAITIIGPAP